MFRDTGMLPGCIIDDPPAQLTAARTYLDYRLERLEREPDSPRRETLLAEIEEARIWVARLDEIVRERAEEQEPGQ